MAIHITENKNGSMQFISDKAFSFELGGTIEPLSLTYETFGSLSSQKDNAILIHHALSYDSHIKSHAKNTKSGWWEEAIGPGKAIDTDRFFVICINNLGSCFGSSGPVSINPKTNKPYRSDFPLFTMNDIARAQQQLIQHLGITQLHAIIGNSMAAMVSLSWGILFPDSYRYLVSISSCYKAYPANIANRVVQKEIIKLDPAWQQGHYEKNPINGLKTARKLGHFTYRNPQILNDKFADDQKIHPEENCNIENYLEYNAEKFAQQFDVNTYLYLLNAMDLFDVTKGYPNPQAAFSRIKAKVLVIAVDSDTLFTPIQQQELYDQLKQAGVTASFIENKSNFGHDAFYVETELFANYIADFIR